MRTRLEAQPLTFVRVIVHTHREREGKTTHRQTWNCAGLRVKQNQADAALLQRYSQIFPYSSMLLRTRHQTVLILLLLGSFVPLYIQISCTCARTALWIKRHYHYWWLVDVPQCLNDSETPTCRSSRSNRLVLPILTAPMTFGKYYIHNIRM